MHIGWFEHEQFKLRAVFLSVLRQESGVEEVKKVSLAMNPCVIDGSEGKRVLISNLKRKI